MFGSPETTTGGNALKFYASIRIDIRRIETLTNGTEAVGNKVRVKIVKNKLSPPFREVELEIAYGIGISKEGSILDAALKYNLIQKAGAWYSYGDRKIGQGRDNAKQFILENPDIGKDIEEKIRVVLLPKDEQKGDATNESGETVKRGQKDLI